MILQAIDGVLNYTYDTAVLLVSGCVSIVALSGVCSVVTFVIIKQLKRISTKKISEAENKIDESADKRETKDLQANADELKGDHRTRWFVKTIEKRIVTLKVLRQESITVASSSGSTSEKDAEIREFLEHLIGTLISENLDDVPLTPLSDDIQYENIFDEYHSKLSKVLSTLSISLHSSVTSQSPGNNESSKPSDLYVELKKIINEVNEKAPLLPSLPEYDIESGPLSIESRLEGQSYEDILSTAVLNKIILKCQNGKQAYQFGDDVDLNITNDFEYRFNNHSWSSSPLERLSLKVEEHIEEITTRYQSSDDEQDSIVECLQSFNLNAGHRVHFPELGKDVVDGYDSYDEDSVMEIVSNVDSWEDNWLFQKKKKHKIKTVAQVSVPMLVPNPSEKYRALIGDVDVDETSDLSECSDSIIEELTDYNTEKSDSDTKTNYIYKYDFKNNLDTGSLKGKHYDDSENYGADHDQDSSGVTSISRDISDVYSFSSLSPCHSEEESLPWAGIREAKNQSIFLGQEDSGEGSLETQPENEYLNDAELEPDLRADKIQNGNVEVQKTSENRQENGISESLAKNDNSSLTDDLAQPPKPGTIAEREHQKWERAAPLPNNPYSKENIEKRSLDNLYVRCHSSMSDQNEAASDECELQESVLRPDIKKYQRDYYVNTNTTPKDKETKNENGISPKHTSSCENVAQNGFSNVSNHDDKPKKPNLVRVLSWSDRKQPEVEIRKRLPSVKELAKQFSGQPAFQEVKKPLTTKNQMVHSLTARSMSKEFRDGLKKSAGKTYNRNVHSNVNDDEVDSLDKPEEVTQNGHSPSKLDTTISFWENI